MRPLSLKPPRPFKNLNAPYRMVFINEDSLEEVASFHLTKKSLYTLFSTIFLITILATVAVLLFTPLKYYIPGYGSNTVRMQAMRLEQQVDSLTQLVAANSSQAKRIQQIIAGKDITERDTAMLKPSLIRSVPDGVLPAAEEIKEVADANIQKERNRGKRKK